MSEIFSSLQTHSRLVVEADLVPVAGVRFQPTGFPDLGPATFDRPDPSGSTRKMLLVESSQSMANRLEATCWDPAARDGAGDLAADLRGLPYVAVDIADGGGTTSSVQEAHRLNSPYVISDADFRKILEGEIGLTKKQAFDLPRFARALMRYDIGSLVHGIFLEKLDGRLRLPRTLSAFIEAEEVREAVSGGVKNDRLDPKGTTLGSGAKGGFGNVPFHRTEYTAARIVAYFSIDLALLRGLGLPTVAQATVALLALYKVQRFLAEPRRLRTACDLEAAADVRVRRPSGFSLPSLDAVTAELRGAIETASSEGLFADPPVTRVTFAK